MPEWKAAVVSPGATMVEAMRVIGATGLQIALVCDEDGRLLGTVTDGDVRRGLLGGLGLEAPVTEIMSEDPVVGEPDQPREVIVALMRALRLQHIPLIDADRRLVGLELLNPGREDRENLVVLMAGGKGTRLRPLTEDTPKPLLRVGSKPILETVLDGFIQYGFRRFCISVNYEADQIRRHFGDGSRWDVEIDYLCEDEPLGTAGALGLLSKTESLPMAVMNGDLLTTVNYDQLFAFHAQSRATATLCVREHRMQIPFGVVDVKDQYIEGIEEKPDHAVLVNAGIYVLGPDVPKMVPRGRYFEMPDLLKCVLAEGERVAAFPIHEYWLDIGRMEDFRIAQTQIEELFE